MRRPHARAIRPNASRYLMAKYAFDGGPLAALVTPSEQ
jgi:hypothetical protein